MKALVVTRAGLPGADSPMPPLWFSDSDENVPLGALRHPFDGSAMFTLGRPAERHALVLGVTDWHRSRGELKRCAAEAWKLLTDHDAEPPMVEAIAAGWIRCASSLEH